MLTIHTNSNVCRVVVPRRQKSLKSLSPETLYVDLYFHLPQAVFLRRTVTALVS